MSIIPSIEYLSSGQLRVGKTKQQRQTAHYWCVSNLPLYTSILTHFLIIVIFIFLVNEFCSIINIYFTFSSVSLSITIHQYHFCTVHLQTFISTAQVECWKCRMGKCRKESWRTSYLDYKMQDQNLKHQISSCKNASSFNNCQTTLISPCIACRYFRLPQSFLPQHL